MASAQDFIEEELVFGAKRRERLWQIIGITGMVFGVLGCLTAGAVAVLDTDPPPVVVPYDPATGLALPNARVNTMNLNERPAISESNIFRYVRDRETYNDLLDNDLRVNRVLEKSDDHALSSMRTLWDSTNVNYPPVIYGADSRLDVDVNSVTLITNNRAQVRLRKRLSSTRGEKTGDFTVTLKFEYRPSRIRSVGDVWENPFGFTVTEYAIRSDKLEGTQ